MNILICTGVGDKEVGGPGQYATKLREEFIASGHKVEIKGYSVEKKLPIGIRHIFFFLKIIPSVIWATRVIALDTFSVGVPSTLAARIFNKKITIRIGGDFLWETYVNRTKEKIVLSQFYSTEISLTNKEKLIKKSTKWLINHVDVLAFNTEWQKNIWQKTYIIPQNKIRIIKNVFPLKQFSSNANEYRFVWAGRQIPLKNLEILKEVFSKVKLEYPKIELETLTNVTHKEVLEALKNSYAAVLPSLSDVCPNFIIESVSLGKPFIMTNETGLKEILPNSGIFINPLDIKAIEAAVINILEEEKYTKLREGIEREYIPRSFKEVGEEFLN